MNYPLYDNDAMGDNLADYVDHGGRVILGQWCFPTAGNYLAGRIMTPDYCPVPRRPVGPAARTAAMTVSIA